jgi:arginyl-tRNA synthetase
MIKKALSLEYNINNDKHLQLLNKKEENDLILKMTSFPDIIKKSFNKLDPQIISNYLETLAAKFHKYYAKHRIINEDKKLTESRLFLIDSLRIILDNGLKVLGIKAKEKM